jgi:hypothetical protein
MLEGLPVTLTPHLTEFYDVTVRRTWRERLVPQVRLHFPLVLVGWTPWVATRVETRERPSQAVWKLSDRLVMHPATWDALRRGERAISWG